MRLPILFLTLAFSLLATACGGGGGGGEAGEEPQLQQLEITLTSVDALDGLVTKTDGTYGGEPGAEPAVGVIKTAAFERAFRAIYSFDLQAISPDARIVSATFRPYQRIVSENAYLRLGALLVDHIDMGDQYRTEAFDQYTLGVVLDAQGDTAILSSTPARRRLSLDVTAEVIADRAAGRSRSQFRVRGASELFPLTPGSDMINMSDEESALTVHPHLVIIYETP